MKFGIISLVIGIIALVFGILLQPFSGGGNIIAAYVSAYLGLVGTISFLVFLLLLSIGAVILGGFGLRKDSSKGRTIGGIAVGVIGIISNAIILYYWVYIISILPYI